MSPDAGWGCSQFIMEENFENDISGAIKNGLDRGYTLDSIRNSLINAGYKQQKVDETIESNPDLKRRAEDERISLVKSQEIVTSSNDDAIPPRKSKIDFFKPISQMEITEGSRVNEARRDENRDDYVRREMDKKENDRGDYEKRDVDRRDVNKGDDDRRDDDRRGNDKKENDRGDYDRRDDRVDRGDYDRRDSNRRDNEKRDNYRRGDYDRRDDDRRDSDKNDRGDYDRRDDRVDRGDYDRRDSNRRDNEKRDNYRRGDYDRRDDGREDRSEHRENYNDKEVEQGNSQEQDSEVRQVPASSAKSGMTAGTIVLILLFLLVLAIAGGIALWMFRDSVADILR
jgi:hypothetical protein